MTRTTLNPIQQEHIADLILDHQHERNSEDRFCDKWMETDSEQAQRAFTRASKRRRIIEAELLERYGIDLQAAIERRLKKTYNTAA